MESLFAQYIKEREGKEIVETDWGFATFKPMQDWMYIEDIYIKPSERRSGKASFLADRVTEIAKNRGFSKLLGTVKPSATGSTESMKALLGYGFKLISAESDAIYFEKTI